jgi:RHS repeat-associated protein
MGYDAAGNLTSLRDTVSPTLYNWNFAADALNRMVTDNRVNAAGTLVVTPGSFSYDGNSNITKQIVGSSTSNYAYDAVKKRLAAVSGGLVRSYAYDVYGNVSGDGEFQYVHDDASNLRQILPSTVGGTYAYDGLHHRVKTTLDGVSTYQMYSINGELLFQYTPAAGTLTEFYYLQGQAIGSRTIETAPAARNAITHVHEDAFGNPIAGTAGAGFPVPGAVVFRQAYAPYGTPLAGTLSYALGFQERTTDYGSSILRYDFGARAYDPEIGIYLEFDFAEAALTHPVTFNPYAYGNGNPFRYATERCTLLARQYGRVQTCAQSWSGTWPCGWPPRPTDATMWTCTGSACWRLSTTAPPWTAHADASR